MAITLRDVCGEDAAFLLEVFRSTRADELAIVPWTDEQKDAFVKFQSDAQHATYHDRFPEASYQIILRDDEAIGRLYVLREPDGIRILDITVLPPYRNAGIGTSLIRELMAEATMTERPLAIWVEEFNPSMRLFQRLGFSKIQENGFNHLMEWRAGPDEVDAT